MAEEFKDQIAALEEQLQGLIEQREEINRKIQHLKQAIDSLCAMHAVPTNPALALAIERQVVGLTNSIAQVLKEEPRTWKTTADVRRMLLFYGISLSKYANASAVIKTVLERLTKKGYAERDSKSEVARYRLNMRPLEEQIEQVLVKAKPEKKK